MDTKKNDVGLYIVDKNYKFQYINPVAKTKFPHLNLGDTCYEKIGGFSAPCINCPIGRETQMFYHPPAKQWAMVQAAEIELPEQGLCHSIQFQIRNNVTTGGSVSLADEQVQEFVDNLGVSIDKECILGCYCETNFPLLYANDNMVKMMGFDSLEEMTKHIDGCVINAIHPDEQESALSNIKTEEMAPGMTYEAIYRMPHKDGHWFWVADNGRYIKTEDGRLAIISHITDITSIFEHQEKLRRDLLERKERLKIVETEALQLLTAINNSYDMIVSVNLSQNTYKLIGTESFVTHGDRMEGVFDEVIRIHGSKVVEEHRKLYLDTFSRNGLLRAHDEGKKTVYLEYQQYDENMVPHWLATYTMFTDDPYSTDVTEITISRNIDERVQKEEESKKLLQDALDAANQANQAKSDFLSSMSHDIRTPMNAIIGMSNLAIQNIENPETARSYMNKVLMASDHLLTLVNDVLDISKVESGKMRLSQSVFCLKDEVERFIEIVRPETNEKNQEFIYQIEGLDNVMVNADKLRINQVMLNILSNAVKYTPVNGKIEMYVKGIPNQRTDRSLSVIYQVKDNGVGMSKEFQSVMYDTFTRGDYGPKKNIQGSGLGLTICKQMVELIGGTISCESAVGEGTTFTISVDLQRVEDRAPETEETKKTAIYEDIKGLHILVAEDNDFNWEIANTILEMQGITTERAEDGQICVAKMEAAEDGYYDLILMDIQMPIMNGYQATEAIRASGREYLQNIPIYAMTADAFAEDVSHCMEVGMNAHISKPIDVDMLLSQIRRGKL